VSRTRPLILALVLTGTVILAAPAASLAASARVPQGFVGVDLSSPLYPTLPPGSQLDQQLTLMAASGVENIRVTIDWSTAQPYRSWSQVPSGRRTEFTNAGGVPTRWGPIDQLVGLATFHGLTVLPTVVDAPLWDGLRSHGTAHPIPRTPGPYAAFMKALVQRYGPRGSFWVSQPRFLPIREWQIWNEPNLQSFWPMKYFPGRYVTLLKAAHAAIKSADPAAQVVLGGLPNFSWIDLSRIYRIKGARNAFDVVAVHPYTKEPRGVISILRLVRGVTFGNHQGHKPIIADEVSWPSSRGQTNRNGKLDFVTTEAGQARNLGRLIQLLANDRRSLGLASFDYYTWATVERRNEQPFDYAGLLKITSGDRYSEKPAYNVFRSEALALERCKQKGATAQICARPG
jgi:hypothetical protein